MRRALFNFFAVLILLSGVAVNCKKKSNGGGGGNNEAPLAVTLSPPSGSNQAPAPQTTFDMTVTVTSTMPPMGVTIDVSSKKDGSTDPAFYTETKSATTSNSPVLFTITGTPVNVICVTTVTVTSKSTPSNKWTGSYTYSRKP